MTMRIALWTTLSFLVILSIIFCHVTIAQDDGFTLPSPDIQRQYQRATERTIKLVLDQLRPHLTLEERHLLDDIDIDITRNTSFTRVYASKEGGSRRIVFNLGFITTMELIQDAALLTSHFGFGASDDFMAYVRDIAKEYHENGRRFRNGLQPKPFPLYASYIGISNDQVRKIYHQGDFQALRVEIKIETIALIIAHEFGHHVLGHLDKPPPIDLSDQERTAFIRKQEFDADNYAIYLVKNSGYSLVLGGYPFYFFAHLGDGQALEMRTHPKGECRFARVMYEGIKNFNRNADFITYLHQTGRYEKWKNDESNIVDILHNEC